MDMMKVTLHFEDIPDFNEDMMKVTLHFEDIPEFNEYADIHQYIDPSATKLYNLCQQFEIVSAQFTLDTVTLEYKGVSMTFDYEHYADLDAFQKQISILFDLLSHKCV